MCQCTHRQGFEMHNDIICLYFREKTYLMNKCELFSIDFLIPAKIAMSQEPAPEFICTHILKQASPQKHVFIFKNITDSTRQNNQAKSGLFRRFSVPQCFSFNFCQLSAISYCLYYFFLCHHSGKGR